MDHKIVTAASIFILFLAFGVISFLVILTRRHPYFVSKKLRLGALLISLTGSSVGCIGTTCYVPIPPPLHNIIHIDQANSQTREIVLDRTTTDTLTGKIYDRQGQTFSYAILDSLDSLIKKDNIFALDGAFDADSEEFKIGLGHSVLSGNYSLRFYFIPKDSIQNYDLEDRSFNLKIIDTLP
jgi:hypothetical protein